MRLFVTGTDTGVGKTTVSSAILRAHPRACYVKPVETGSEDGESEEARRIRALVNREVRMDVPYLFATPVAPLVAQELEGKVISIPRIEELVEELSHTYDPVIIEGAGGLLVPITPEVSFLQLTLRLKAEVIVVVGNRLGCINHTLLTFEVLRQHGIPIQGWVLNHLSREEDPAIKTNLEVLTRYLGPPLAVVPYPLPEGFEIPLGGGKHQGE
jgi:dethiobiotin synthase